METAFHCEDHIQTIRAVTIYGRRVERHWPGRVLCIKDDGLGQEFIYCVGDMDNVLYPFREDELEHIKESV